MAALRQGSGSLPSLTRKDPYLISFAGEVLHVGQGTGRRWNLVFVAGAVGVGVGATVPTLAARVECGGGAAQVGYLPLVDDDATPTT